MPETSCNVETTKILGGAVNPPPEHTARTPTTLTKGCDSNHGATRPTPARYNNTFASTQHHVPRPASGVLFRPNSPYSIRPHGSPQAGSRRQTALSVIHPGCRVTCDSDQSTIVDEPVQFSPRTRDQRFGDESVAIRNDMNRCRSNEKSEILGNPGQTRVIRHHRTRDAALRDNQVHYVSEKVPHLPSIAFRNLTPRR